mmetsp:Transcript_25176/g.33728  ORF Transcript_25176/g.33728 Transcript_25176/m.33728 type:complete len:89 (+) Transcript_25176:301-567(+)
MDQSALTLIEADKKLEGVVVSDPSKVIEDFKNTKLYKPAPGPGNYNIVGSVPKVNDDLAKKYVGMKETIRRQRMFQEAHARMLTESHS